MNAENQHRGVSNKIRSARSVVWLVALTALLELVVLATSNRVVESIAGLPLVLIIPGAALFAASTPALVGAPIGERIMWTVLASLGITVLGGLLLNLVGGLTRDHWLILIAILVCAGSIVALCRAPEGNGIERTTLSDAASDSQLEPNDTSAMRRLRLHDLLAIAICLSLVVGALTLSQLSTTATSEHFAQLWLVPAPKNVSGNSGLVELGVQNFEGQAASFSVNLYVVGSEKPVGTWPIVLRNKASWKVEIRRPATAVLRATLGYPSEPKPPKQFVTLQPPGY